MLYTLDKTVPDASPSSSNGSSSGTCALTSSSVVNNDGPKQYQLSDFELMKVLGQGGYGKVSIY